MEQVGRNPYFAAEAVTEHITRIRGVIGENMYLIEGRHQALLIDTGCGIGDIAGFVRTLTDKPLTVALTHNHYDHCGGMYRFSKVHLNEKERGFNSVSYTDKKGREVLGHTAFTDTSAITRVREIEYEDLAPGQVFELGGVRGEAILCPGHTVATMCFLFLPDRLLLCGDACHQITYLQFPEALPLSEFAKSLEALQRREQEWDSLLLSHAPDQAPKTLIMQQQQLAGRLLELPEGGLAELAEGRKKDAYVSVNYEDKEQGIFHARLVNGSAEMLLREQCRQKKQKE